MSTPQTHPRRLIRRYDDRMIAGVCSGVATYLGVDVTLVRLVTVLGAVFSCGTFIVAYVAAWILLPQE
jgi:phage shock protein C